MAALDPRQVKSQQRKAWDNAASGWRKWSGTIGKLFEPVTEMLVDMAGVGEGQWVLDVATGTGDAAFGVAARVGPQGKVVGVDLSRKMLQVADERARAAGLGNVAFHELDAEELSKWPEGSYDAALCRFALMLLPQLGIALRGIHRVLTPGGMLAAAVWGAPEKVPFLSVPAQAIATVLGAPPGAGAPTPFDLAEPGKLEQAMSSAGFRQIQGERMTVVLELPSVDNYLELVKDTSHAAAAITAEPKERQDAIWAGVTEAVKPFIEADGKVVFLCDLTCVAGRKG